MSSRRALLGFAVCASVAGPFGCTRSHSGPPAPQRAEDVWLSRVGTGPSQTGRACGRGATDRFALALCDKTTPAINDLAQLYRVLRLDQPSEMAAATATHSLGLSSRTVSALNPRMLPFQNISDKSRQPTYEQAAVTTFARGEQMVEMTALDPTTYDFNFYLLRFEQACNHTRCTPEDLLTEKIENGWTDWTL